MWTWGCSSNANFGPEGLAGPALPGDRKTLFDQLTDGPVCHQGTTSSPFSFISCSISVPPSWNLSAGLEKKDNFWYPQSWQWKTTSLRQKITCHGNNLISCSFMRSPSNICPKGCHKLLAVLSCLPFQAICNEMSIPWKGGSETFAWNRWKMDWTCWENHP